MTTGGGTVEINFGSELPRPAGTDALREHTREIGAGRARW
jgi:hypothetical protein